MQKSSIDRIIISGGGTGGHIFPAIAIADAVRSRYPDAEILFVGAMGRMEMQRVPKAGYRIEGLPVQGLDRKHLWRNVKVLLDFFRAERKAKRLVRSFKPDVVVGVGGYASAPTLRAAQSLGIPTLLQEQNSFAGKANKILAKRAKSICVAYPNMERFFPKETLVITGNPVRPIIEDEPLPNREEALGRLGFSGGKYPLLLVVGGSLGARTINETIEVGLPRFIETKTRLVWQTGKAFAPQAEESIRKLGPEAGQWIKSMPFIDHMEDVFSCADVVISRAGATTISELCLLGKPSILVPSPNVAEDHQTCNARALSTRDAAILVPDAEARNILVDRALDLIQDPQRQMNMAKNIKTLAMPHSAQRIVDLLEEILSR